MTELLRYLAGVGLAGGELAGGVIGSAGKRLKIDSSSLRKDAGCGRIKSAAGGGGFVASGGQVAQPLSSKAASVSTGALGVR